MIVVNISKHGLMFQSEIASRLSAGDKVAVTIRDAGTLTGEVRWARANRCGLLFETPVDIDTLIKKRTKNKSLSNNVL